MPVPLAGLLLDDVALGDDAEHPPEPSTTGTPEIRRSSRIAATSFSGASGPTVATSAVITSLTFIALSSRAAGLFCAALRLSS